MLVYLKLTSLTQFLWMGFKGWRNPLNSCVNVLFLGEKVHSFSPIAKGVWLLLKMTNLRFRKRWPPCMCTAESSPALGFPLWDVRCPLGICTGSETLRIWVRLSMLIQYFQRRISGPVEVEREIWNVRSGRQWSHQRKLGSRSDGLGQVVQD